MKIKNQEHFPPTSMYNGECVFCSKMTYRYNLCKCIWCGEPACYGCAKTNERGNKIYICDNPICQEQDAKADEPQHR